MSKWIPTEEKNPERDGFYMATLDGEIAGEREPFRELQNSSAVNGATMRTIISAFWHGCQCQNRTAKETRLI